MHRRRAEIRATQLIDGESADEHLRTFFGIQNSVATLWTPLHDVMLSNYRSLGPLAVWSGPGSVAFHRGTPLLRGKLAPYGWRTPRQLQESGEYSKLGLTAHWADIEQTGLCVSPDLTRGVSLVATDEMTCSGLPPQVKRPRGYATRTSITPNTIFARSRIIETPFEWGFVMHFLTKNGGSFEFGIPASISESGIVNEWRDPRTILIDRRPSQAKTEAGLANDPTPVDLPPTRVEPK